MSTQASDAPKFPDAKSNKADAKYIERAKTFALREYKNGSPPQTVMDKLAVAGAPWHLRFAVESWYLESIGVGPDQRKATRRLGVVLAMAVYLAIALLVPIENPFIRAGTALIPAIASAWLFERAARNRWKNRAAR